MGSRWRIVPSSDVVADFPTTPIGLTTAWAGSLLVRNGIDATGLRAVSATRIGTGLIGDSYRLVLEWEGHRPPGAPETLVVKLPAEDATSRQTGVGLRNYEREVRFYREIAPTMGIRLAKPWSAEWDEGDGSFVVVLEDLAPARVGDQLRGCTVAEAESVVDAAALMHASHWNGQELTGYASWMSTTADEERAGQLGMLWSFAWPQFLERHGHRLDADARVLAERFGAVIGSWARDRPGPMTVVHGDFRTDNMLFGGTVDRPTVVPVDWQTPAIGPGVGDVAYFIGASLMTDERRANESRLVRRWFDGLVAAGVRGYSWDSCWEDYRRMSFSGALMGVAASMLTPQTERGDEMFFAMTSRHLRQASDVDAAALLA